MSEVKTWTIDSECLIHGGLNQPVDMVLKSDYDALKAKLEKAEKVISSINLEFKTYGLFHYDDCTSLYDEDEKCSCGSFSAENRINKAIREYIEG